MDETVLCVLDVGSLHRRQLLRLDERLGIRANVCWQHLGLAAPGRLDVGDRDLLKQRVHASGG